MSGPYSTLAPIYDVTGASAYAERLVQRLLNFAQRNDWMGRRILDVGCGTGAAMRWLGQQGYNVYGVDISPEMLAQARTTLQNASLNIQLLQQDMRSLDSSTHYDMVLALDVLNELDSLRSLETFFKGAHSVLNEGQLLIFDLHTIEGLARDAMSGDRIDYDDPVRLTVVTRNSFDYERQIHAREYLIFRSEGGTWQRERAVLTRRAYPVQAVISLLARSGFEIVSTLNRDMMPHEPGSSGAERVFVIARRTSA